MESTRNFQFGLTTKQRVIEDALSENLRLQDVHSCKLIDIQKRIHESTKILVSFLQK